MTENKPQRPDPSAPGHLFAAGGAVARAIRNFEPREQQGQMADAVYKAVSGRTHLIVEAGTGVGKSLAYLLPAALWAVRNKKKVVVATHTKALQAQLVKKDLPVVKAILEEQGLQLNYFLLMGSANYLCLSRLERAYKQGEELFEEDGSKDVVSELTAWVKLAASGCRPEIPLNVPQRVWEEVCRDPDICLGRKCAHQEACFYRKEVALAKAADIIVANQHLFFAGMPVPAFDAVIFDEAHNLEDVASAFMGFSLTDRKVKRLLDDIFNQKSGKGLVKRLKTPPANWLPAMQQAVADVNFASRIFFHDIKEKLGFDDPDGGTAKARRVRKPRIVENTLAQPLLALTVLLSEAIGHSKSAQEEAEIKGHLVRCLALAEQTAAFLKCEDGDNAYWVENSYSKRTPSISLNMSPVDVAEYLRKELFGNEYPVILTSATLAVDGAFRMVKTRLGIDSAAELLLDSPFDYQQQAVIYVPQTIPDPAEAQAYEAALIEECFRISAAVSGGIFLLFTGWQILDKAHKALERRLGGRPLFRQGDKLPQQLLTDFRRAGNGVLFATDTFWQGVDVQGPALSCVVIARLPFTSPDTPLEEARHEWMTARGINVFNEYSLPKAVVKFRQGFGRLIRSKTDFGAVVVLDPRIRTRRYGPKFLRSIPKCFQVSGLTELKAFFDCRKE